MYDQPSFTTTTGRWNVDAAASAATFTVQNLGKTVHGSVPIIHGTVDVGADGHPLAVEATLDLSSIDTGIPKRDKDLRAPRLLDLDRHPAMTFASTRCEGESVEGVLSARGTSTIVRGSVKTTRGPDGELESMRGTTTFDRRELGVSAPRFMIGRQITVTVVARMTRA